jgi:hypothetical protein
MIKVPAEKLASAIEKHLLPGVLRSLAEQQRTQQQENEKKSC